MLIKHFKRTLLVLALVSLTPVVFAEDAAPVYDADSMPSQFDGQPDSGASSASSAVTSPAPAQQLQPEHSFVSPQTLTLDQRLARVEQQLNNPDRNVDAAKVEELQKEIQTLRGQVEELTHQVQAVQAQSSQLHADVDKRLSKQAKAAKTAPEPEAIEEAPVKNKTVAQDATKSEKTDGVLTKTESTETKTTESKTPTADQPNVAEEQQTYQTAYDLIKAKKYNDAISALQKMLQKYPSGQFAANAHYWLGELYGLTGKNDKSANEFASVMNDFPDSPKVPDAQLKLGLIYVADQKWADAKSAFKRVMRKYPGTSSAHLAAEQIKQLKQAGH